MRITWIRCLLWEPTVRDSKWRGLEQGPGICISIKHLHETEAGLQTKLRKTLT